MLKKTLILLLLVPTWVFAIEDVSLFTEEGEAVAYIGSSSEQTVYLWTGQPVAYLTVDEQGGHHIFGFNGTHLGWYVDEIFRDQNGDIACGTSELIQSTKLAPMKGYKKFKPLKSLREYLPPRPDFSNNFAKVPCHFLLYSGVID